MVSFPTWVSTHCSGKTLLARFARGFPRVALGNSAGSRRCCVTSPGSRVGITAVDAAGSAMLRLWHGLGLLQMVGFKARVQRTGFQVNLARVGGRSKRVQEHKKRERVARWRVVLNSPIWTPPTGGWSNQSVCMV